MSDGTVVVLWLVFLVFFVVMTIREVRAASRGLPVREYDLGFSDMNEAQDILRQAIIEADRSSHKTAAWSYGSAAAVALLSLILAMAT